MGNTYDVILLTESRYEHPSKTDWYIDQILLEDKLVQDALERQGLRTARFDWNRSDIDWSDTGMCLFRTTWDYFHQFGAFQKWLDRVKPLTRFVNSIDLVTWNMDKHYLSDLAAGGVRIPPTLFIEQGDKRTLSELHAETGWSETVLKPAVSGAGRHTYRIDPDSLDGLEETYRSLIEGEAMLLQPFQYDVVRSGELALMVIDGQVTHAVRKIAKPGEFRVQDDFGGRVHPHDPTQEEILFAEAAVEACPDRPYYARVDMIRDNGGHLALAELELIEPEMWFRECPPAAERLAETVAGLMGHS